ncbi:hypothetical protein [Lentzea albidocapillata]|nr:hypothetical protein [Lentzea albidocapillata]
MPGAGSMRTIARASLARVFAVLALVVGIALLQGTPCDRDTALTAQCATSSTLVLVDSPSPPTAIGTASELLEDLGGVSGACLAVLLTVLLGLVVLRRPGSIAVSVVRVPLPWQGPDPRPGVRLTQLCVLRA